MSRVRLLQPGSHDRPDGGAAAWLTRRPSRGRRLAAATLASVGVACALVALIWLSFLAYDRTAERAATSARAADQMLEAMLNQETGVRGYLNTGDPRFLEPDRAGRRDFAAAVGRLRADVQPGTAAGARLDRTLAAAARWRAMADTLSGGVRDGRPLAPTLSAALVRKREMDRFRAANAALQTVLAARATERRAAARRRAAVTLGALAVLLGAALAAGLASAGRRERRSDARLRALVHNSLDLLTVVDADMRVLYTSPAAERVLGHAPGALVGRPLRELVHPDDAPEMLARFAQAVREPGVSGPPAVCRLRHADGGFRWFEHARNNLLAHPGVRGVVLNSRDVTEREELAAALRRQAFTDRLTGLANRARFEDRLTALADRDPRGPARGCVVLLDLDDFKLVNDSLGHVAGDRLLRAVAGRLATVVRPEDTLARLGGDEFAIVTEGADPHAAGAAVAERCLAALAAPFDVEGRTLTASPSLGIALVPPGGDVDAVLRNADLALYQAKRGGKRRAATYEDALHATAVERLALDEELPRAVERDELVQHFQPIHAIAGGRLVGFEALLRWHHPRHGLIGPAGFIEVAEANGAIVGIGRWVLGAACRQLATWQRAYGAELAMSINLSAVQLEDPALVGDVAAALRDAALEPATVVLEITETALMRDPGAAAETLHALKRLGVRLALDDFGTGFSSLARLRTLPFDALKLPKPFVDGIAVQEGDREVARGIVDLARGMRLRVVAEGIEDAAQLCALREIGCDLGQGYHLARPADAATIEEQVLRPLHRRARHGAAVLRPGA